MDLPEMRIVRRVLAEHQLDPVVALAVILRALSAEHVERWMKLDDAEAERCQAAYDVQLIRERIERAVG
jgi:hypothetical protein